MSDTSLTTHNRASDGTASTTDRASCTPAQRVTRSLLGYGIVAGPFYVVVSITQALMREGFDLRRHEWSLLATGGPGWIQIANFIITGAMVVTAALGLSRAWTTGTGHRAAPILIAIFGTSLVGAGIFTADPMLGFPVGTPDGPPAEVSLHGILHLVSGGVGFACLIAAFLVIGRRFRRQGEPGWAWFSRITGVLFLAGFAGVSSGATSPGMNMAFTAAVVLSWSWLSALSVHVYRDQQDRSSHDLYVHRDQEG